MKRTGLIIIGVISILVIGWWSYNSFLSPATQTQTAEEAAEAAEQETLELENVIWASGKLEPVLWAELSLDVSGAIRSIHVTEGEWVEADTLLLELDTNVLRSQVEVAAGALAEAEAAKAQLMAGATADQIASAEAEVAAAEAEVSIAAGQMVELEDAIHAAEAQARLAQRQYEELDSHPTLDEQTVAKAEVMVAQAAITQAQAAYNLVRGDPQISARPESRGLYEATAALEVAQARANMVNHGPTVQQLAIAQSQVDAAYVAVDMAESRVPGVEAQVRAALAHLEGARATRNQLLAGATKEEIDIAEARVQSALAALAMSKAELAKGQLVSPFAGRVGAIHPRIGELVTPGQPLILLGDTSQMHVKTTDLRETDVVRLATNMPVEVSFDALPDKLFQSRITRIAPVSTAEKGSTNYTVEVDVDTLDSRLRWGMTAFVNIQAPK